MTHKELMAVIDDMDHSCSVVGVMAQALRNVLLRHMPTPEDRYGNEVFCTGCSFTETGYYVLYPCLSVKAIAEGLLNDA